MVESYTGQATSLVQLCGIWQGDDDETSWMH